MTSDCSNPGELTIRTYQPSDHGAVRRLFVEGRLVGAISPNDTGADMDNIESEYLGRDGAHFWVAQSGDEIVGMVGVAEDEPDIAQIRRLRVKPECQGQTGVAAKLMETAISFCRHHGYLKVVLDTAFETRPAIETFDRFAFHHDRTRSIGGKEVLEFYLDLYHQPKKEERRG
jgi:ribosomal protein S18 acetylase RimI-like enzyme